MSALDDAYERIVRRLMTFGGIDRRHIVGDHEEGSFWVNRDDVLRLLEEELGRVEGNVA
jgi:hypothetical protein